MAFEVVFTKTAEKDFENILTYIEKKFGTSVSIHTKDLIIEFTSLIQSFPEIGSIISEHNIRGFVLHRRLKIFYRIKGSKIILLRLFDTRQHPDKRF